MGIGVGRKRQLLVIACGWALAAIGCGSVANEGNDAAPPDAAADAPDGPRCSPTASFGSPVPVVELNTEGRNDMARLSPDELTVYFHSDRPGTQGPFDIYIARRSSRDQAFDPPALLAGVNTDGSEAAPATTSDELTLYTLNESIDIFLAERASTDDPFGDLAPLDAVNTDEQETEPFILPDNSALYFSRNEAAAAASFDMFFATRNGNAFNTPTRVEGVELNTPDADALPVVTADELTLFFSSDRPGGLGDFDIWVTTRSDRTTGFGAPTNVAELNTADRDQPTWLSPDGCVLYISRHTATTQEIFVATRGF